MLSKYPRRGNYGGVTDTPLEMRSRQIGILLSWQNAINKGPGVRIVYLLTGISGNPLPRNAIFLTPLTMAFR